MLNENHYSSNQCTEKFWLQKLLENSFNSNW